MDTTQAVPESRPPPRFSVESEVELLSYRELGSMSPTKFGPVTTRVRRSRVDRRPEQMRTLGILAGAVVIVAMGMSMGVLAVVAIGIR